MQKQHDTIVAISTPPGAGGIAVVRLSGPDSIAIADRLFVGRRPSCMPANTFAYGQLRRPVDQELLDEVILLVFRKPSSYTAEDVVEIQAHGGGACAKRILQAATALGARPAEPGEFTRRAFLNGRIDLVQAEAVADLIAAKTERSAAAAADQITGALSSDVSKTYDSIVATCSRIEAGIDFPEEDLPEAHWPEIVEGIQNARGSLEELLGRWHEGRLLREGALVVICGLPNAGKSTLLNCLLKSERALVHEEPGTTRDTVEEELVLNGIALRLVDTAGLRESGCKVEKAGVERAESYLARADLVVYVLDASGGLSSEDQQRLADLSSDRVVVVLNKTDIGNAVNRAHLGGLTTVESSLINQSGVSEIRGAIAGQLGICQSSPPGATLAARHKDLVEKAVYSLRECEKLLETEGETGETPAITYLREAAEYVGSILGRTYHADLLDRIFSDFCVGK
jgi:tRNA modification GTPase